MLWERYRMPIYAHPLDIPYISGERRRPPFPPIPWLGDWIANSPRPLPPEALIPVEEGALVLGWQTCPATPRGRLAFCARGCWWPPTPCG